MIEKTKRILKKCRNFCFPQKKKNKAGNKFCRLEN